MVEHDGQVGQLLKKLDDLGIANNTIVIYTTDNGAETFTWPDGGTTPFRGEKNTNWEGSYRVPALVRWPGLVQPRTEINDIVSAEDWVPTLVAAAGEPDIKDKLLQGYSAGDKTFKVHLDGYDQRDLFAGKGPDKRREFFYWTDDGNLAGLRYDQYKVVFMEQQAHGLEVWMQPLGAAARAEDIQPALRPLRACGARGRRLRQMVHRARVRSGSGAGDRGAAPGNVPGVPAAAEAGQLLGRPGHGKADEPERRQLAAASRVRRDRNMKPCIPSFVVNGRRILLAATVMVAILFGRMLPVLKQAEAQTQDQKANVVFILADNVGYGDFGSYGGGELRGAPTPQSRPAGRGGIAAHAVSGRASLHAVRAALMTGQYSIRNGLSLIAVEGSPNTLSAHAFTMGEMFKGAGYSTAIFGKWHLGSEPQSLPTAHGFDEFYGIPPDISWDAATYVDTMELTHSIPAPP